MEQNEETINQEETKERADDDPIDPSEKSESVEDEIVVVAPEIGRASCRERVCQYV